MAGVLGSRLVIKRSCNALAALSMLAWTSFARATRSRGQMLRIHETGLGGDVATGISSATPRKGTSQKDSAFGLVVEQQFFEINCRHRNCQWRVAIFTRLAGQRLPGPPYSRLFARCACSAACENQGLIDQKIHELLVEGVRCEYTARTTNASKFDKRVHETGADRRVGETVAADGVHFAGLSDGHRMAEGRRLESHFKTLGNKTTSI